MIIYKPDKSMNPPSAAEEAEEEPLVEAPPVAAVASKKKEGGEAEDMIQMALRMAEEMSQPVEDMESNIEPLAVKNG